MLKLKIHKDLLTGFWAEQSIPEAADKQQRATAKWLLRCPIKRALASYCAQPAYLQASLEGAVPPDGSAAGAVSAPDARPRTPPPCCGARPRRAGRPPETPPAPLLPKDVTLTEDAIVSGRLELTVKFNQLPKAVELQGGYEDRHPVRGRAAHRVFAAMTPAGDAPSYHVTPAIFTRRRHASRSR